MTPDQAILAHLAKRPPAPTADSIARAICYGAHPSIVVQALNALRVEQQITASTVAGKLHYRLAGDPEPAPAATQPARPARRQRSAPVSDTRSHYLCTGPHTTAPPPRALDKSPGLRSAWMRTPPDGILASELATAMDVYPSIAGSYLRRLAATGLLRVVQEPGRKRYFRAPSSDPTPAAAPTPAENPAPAPRPAPIPMLESLQRAKQPPTRTKTEQLLDVIRQKPCTTEELRKATGLDNSQVWGLLQHPRQTGQVERAGGVWRMTAMDDALLSRDLDRAADLLRRHGFCVSAAGGGA